MCCTSGIAGLALREPGVGRVPPGCEPIPSPVDRPAAFPRGGSTPASAGDALAAAADRQLLIDGSIQRLQLQIGRYWLNLANVRDLGLAVADQGLPRHAHGVDPTAPPPCTLI